MQQANPVPLGELITTLLDYALQAYQKGQLVLTPVAQEVPLKTKV
ncbi:MAG TPA: hypothetical protein PK530_00900 [Anaerolineales bacterium]|nr:hypothetical protein [Anaerolineales bacterium]